MTKQEFLDELRACLEEQIPGTELAETLNYYREYMAEEEAQGKTEEEVTASLGSPRLIAHSILDAHQEAVTGTTSGYYDAEEETYREEGEVPAADKMRYLVNKGVSIVVLLGIAIVALTLFRFMAPIIIIGIVALWLYRIFDR